MKMILMIKKIIKWKRKTKKTKTSRLILWAPRVKHENDLIIVDQDQYIEVCQVSTGDNLLIIIQIVIDNDQIQEYRAPFKDCKTHPRVHRKHKNHLHAMLDANVQIVFK